MYATGNDSTKPGTGENAGELSSFSYDIDMHKLGFALTAIDKDGVGKGAKMVFACKLDKIKLAMAYEALDMEKEVETRSNIFFSFKYMSGHNSIKFAYGIKENYVTDTDPVMAALAYDFMLNRKTTLYALWTNGAHGGLNDASKLTGDASVFAAGIIAKF